jgi:hypothetical protein
MAKILIIHGYGSGANYSIFKKYPKDLEFSGFKKIIDSHDVTFFRWFKETNFSFLQTLNPFTHLNLYISEKKDIYKKEVIEKLHTLLQNENPQIIVCHSMGSQLLKNYLDEFELPNSVKKILLVQADIPHTTKFRTNSEIKNVYCFWDPSLLCSLFINFYIPAGLIGLKSATKNIFFPLLKLPNLHLSSIKSTKILELIDD